MSFNFNNQQDIKTVGIETPVRSNKKKLLKISTIGYTSTTSCVVVLFSHRFQFRIVSVTSLSVTITLSTLQCAPDGQLGFIKLFL